MRLPDDRIKDALLQPDRMIRDCAIRFFYSARNPDQSLMPLAIEALERYGRTTAFSFTHFLNLLPQTEETIEWVIAELHRDLDGEPAETRSYFMNLGRLLGHADIRLVAPRSSRIEHAPHMGATERLAFLDRLGMAEWSAEACWQALTRHCEINQHIAHVEDFDLGHAVRIIEALARQPHAFHEQILAILSQQSHQLHDGTRRWLLPLMAILAGEMRLQGSIPLLVRNLGHPSSFLSDQCLFALAKIGNDEAVCAVCERFPHSSTDYRLYASELLCNIHLDSTVERVLELLHRETAVNVQMTLCTALLNHFSFEGIEPARQFVKRHDLDPNVRELRCGLVAACTIMDAPFPELETWRLEAAKDFERTQEKMTQMAQMFHEAGGDLGALVARMKAQLATKTPVAPGHAAPPRSRLPDSTRRQPQRAAGISPSARPTRVGRNDPCPCRSGKKFKHCCINK